ncbi:hypothetical protein BDR03DRAFT_1018621 [Suillus americanus]|nr:hypothetical protein BDR03DRAFT_1018621 [Suillus americanus]
MCRKHCWVSGGCDAKGHNVLGPAGEVPRLHPPPEVTPAPSVVHPAILHISSRAAPPPPIIDPALSCAVPPLPIIDPTLSCAAPPPPVIDPALLVPGSSSQTPTAGPSTVPTASQMCKGKGRATVPAHDADFYFNPRLPSQLPPVFTDAYAKQEAEHLQKYEAQSLERELAVTAQNTVTAFGWVTDGDTPASGFTILDFPSTMVVTTSMQRSNAGTGYLLVMSSPF